ncbi:MAG: hypothetical protein LBT16_02890 [Treponema sp.]|nr:hypothetical protein [Treponema sp.]
MTPTQFGEECRAARVDYSAFKSINTDTETMEQAIDGFASFESSQESIKAIHEAGRMVP